MTGSLVSSFIDLTRLPAPAVIEPVSYLDLLAQRMARLTERFTEAGIAFDTGDLEAEPARILQEEDAFRQMLDRTRINDAVRAVLPAFARDSNLDAIVLRAGILRLDWETDAHLLQRYLAAFGRPAAGSVDGYVYAALTALPELRDIAVHGPEVHGQDGRVRIVIARAPGEPVTMADIETVRAACSAKSVRPLTDVVTVQAAETLVIPVDGVLTVARGPDPAVVLSASLEGLETYAEQSYSIGSSSPVNALAAALYTPNVRRVVLTSPLGDVVVGPYQVASIVPGTILTQVAP